MRGIFKIDNFKERLFIVEILVYLLISGFVCFFFILEFLVIIIKLDKLEVKVGDFV